MSLSIEQKKSSRRGFRSRLLGPLNLFRHSSRDPPNNGNNVQGPRTQEDLQLTPSLVSDIEYRTTTHNSRPLGEIHYAPENTAAIDDAAPNQNNQNTALTTTHRRSNEDTSSSEQSALGDIAPSDLWSAAYSEAVYSLSEAIDITILKGKSIEQLFQQLEEIDKESYKESAFRRGAKYLKKIEIPLQRFKLALDLATPLTDIQPTAATVFGVVKGVTAIAITFATADVEFAKQIGEMLEQLSYIDDCDILGQKSDNKNIHKALVAVYKKILEFYKAAYEIVTRKGAKMVMKLLWQKNTLPDIVQEFLKTAKNLQDIIQLEARQVLEDIKGMLYDLKITEWLGGEQMTRLSETHTYLQKDRADKACDFLLEDAHFKDWYEAPHFRQLVIHGDMGCGKSVAISFLIDTLNLRNEFQLPRPKTCYYYCRDDETGQATYIFSALILELLIMFPGQKKFFVQCYEQAQASGVFQPTVNITKLKEFLQKILDALDRPLFIIIDGLDECDRGSRKEVLELLNVLSKGKSSLKVMLSCRPEAEILQQLGEIPKIDFGPSSQRDGIIVQKLVEEQLGHLPNNIQAIVIEKLSHFAQGSAIWVSMVVKLIEKKHILGENTMQRFLKEIPLPDDLSGLYDTVLSRYASDDLENQNFARTALKVLAVARRPLSILELAWAVTLDSNPQELRSVEALAQRVDHQRIMSLIRPFISQVDFRDVKRRQVRLVHQSVKEFVLNRLASTRLGIHGTANSGAVNPAHVNQGIENLEADILNICITYLLLTEVGCVSLFSDEQTAIEELPQDFDLFNNDKEVADYDPYCTWEVWEETMIRYDPIERGFGEFFVYASCHWIAHFRAISAEPLPALASIEKLCQAGSIRINNWIEQNRRPDCVIKPRFEFDSSLYDPLSITSLYGSEAMLRNMLDNSDFTNGKFLPEPAMGAADQIFQWGDLFRLKILFLEGSVKHQLHNLDFFWLAVKRWYGSDKLREGWDTVFDLIDNVSDAMVNDKWGNELLCMAAGKGCLPLVQRLMDKAQRSEELRTELLLRPRQNRYRTLFGKSAHQSIGEAVLGNHVDVVKYLLTQRGIKTHLQHQNSFGENVLHLASKTCNPEIFRLLVPRFKEGVHQTDDQRNTPLSRVILSSASAQHRSESAKILLLGEGSANQDGYSGDQEHPLRIAVQLGDLEMCRLMITIGKLNPAPALMHDADGNVVLKDSSYGSEQTVLAISKLLRRHANFGSMSA